MPHIHLETTSDLIENTRVPEILGALVSRLSSLPTISSSSIKAYHSLRPVWVMGEGAPPGFAHCTVSILSGRSEETRQQFADQMYKELLNQFAESIQEGVAGITLEVRDMDRETYRTGNKL